MTRSRAVGILAGAVALVVPAVLLLNSANDANAQCSGIPAIGVTGPAEHTFVVDPFTHDRFKLAFPITFTFDTNATSVTLNGVAMPTEVTTTTGRNLGEEVARFCDGRAYVSAVYPADSDTIALVFDAGANYTGVATYYDDRDAAVVFSGDDWGGVWDAEFAAFCDVFTQLEMWFTIGICPNGMWCYGAGAIQPPDFALIRSKITAGYIEPSSHSFQHMHPPYNVPDCEIVDPSYFEEIVTSRDSLLLELGGVLPAWMGGQIVTWIEPYGESDAAIRDTLSFGRYLVDRQTVQGWSSWSNWDAEHLMWGRVGTSNIYDADTVETRRSFNEVTGQGGLWNSFGHPGTSDLALVQPTFEWIAGRDYIWYAALGQVGLYETARIFTRKVGFPYPSTTKPRVLARGVQ